MSKMVKEKDVTTKDIARYLGVHHTTVSRALRGILVSKETIQRVREAAKTLGYMPNLGARIMVSGRTDMFGLLVPDPTSSHIIHAVLAFQNEALKRGQHVVLGPYQEDMVELEKYMDFLVYDRRADGLVVFSMPHPQMKDLLDCFAGKLPIVTIGRPNVQFVHWVSIDYSEVRRKMAKHLLKLGHERIGLILNILGQEEDPHKANIRRAQSFKEALNAKDIEWPENELLASCRISMQEGYNAGKRLLSVQPRPTAIFCAHDVLAMGVLRAASDANFRVPQDLSVAGFGNTDWTQFFDLTTGDSRFDLVAERSLGILRRVLTEGREKTGTLGEIITPELIFRGSTGPVPHF